MTNLSDLLPAGAASKQLSFTASGTIASGKPVILNTNGTATQVAATSITENIGSAVTYGATNQTEYPAVVFDPDSNKVIVAYRDNGNSNYGTARVGTVSGDSISFGTAVVFQSSGTNHIDSSYDTGEDKVLIVYQSYDEGNGPAKAIVGTVSGTSISFGSALEVEANQSLYVRVAYSPDAGKHMIIYSDGGNGSRGAARLLTVSGTSVTRTNPEVVYESNSVSSPQDIVYDTTNDKFVVAYDDNNTRGRAKVGTVSGSSITFTGGSAFDLSGINEAEDIRLAFDSNLSKVVIAYQDKDNSQKGVAIVGEVSGTDFNSGTKVEFEGGITDVHSIVFDSTANKVVIQYRDQNNSNYGQYVVGTPTSGNSISFATPVAITNYNNNFGGAAFDTNAGRTVIALNDNTNNRGKAYVLQVGATLTNLTATNFLGIADAAISNAASGNITMKGGVAINSAISPAAVVTAGSKVVFDDGGPTTGISLVYDPDNSKIVTAFCTTTLHGIVGTVSGTGISYGSAVAANSNNSGEAQIVYDTANDKVVVIYTNNNNSYGEAVVGTVSGTSISWGSVVVWNSASTSGLSAAYDTNAGKVLVAWKNSGTASGIVGTVSGTSISFGSSATIFSGGNLQETRMVYDSNAQKSVVAIRDYSPQKGYAVVATISGTSVTVGSSVEFLSSEVTSQSIALAYNSTDNNVVIAYSKAGDSNNGFLAIGTISGTSISFAGETKYSSSNQTNYVKLAYKSSGNMLGIIYNIGGSTTVKFNHATISGTTFSFGTEQELTAGATDSTAITLDVASDNFVASYGDGANNSDGTTNVVNLNTSLVPNTTYYVQDDGTLSTTSSTVTAGKAMSTTSINLDYST